MTNKLHIFDLHVKTINSGYNVAVTYDKHRLRELYDCVEVTLSSHLDMQLLKWKTAKFVLYSGWNIINPLYWKYFRELLHLWSYLCEIQPKKVFLSTTSLAFAISPKMTNDIHFVIRHHNNELDYYEALKLNTKSPIKSFALSVTQKLFVHKFKKLNKDEKIQHVFYSSEDLEAYKNQFKSSVVSQRLDVVPIYHNLSGRELCSLDDVEYLIFFGSSHGPNLEVVDWLIENILPLLANVKLKRKLHVFIACPSLASEEKSIGDVIVHFHNYLENPYNFPANKTIYLLPAFSGSGIKIKIAETAKRGLCVIANESAFNGLLITNKCEISDDKVLAAKQVKQILEKLV